VVPTLGLSAIALPLLGAARALAVINSNYVAVLKVASPLGMLNFLQRASRAGILIKDGRALEAACKVDTVVFDKTGTLTEPEPHVGEIHAFGGIDPDDLLGCAAAVEANQSHPIAMAILEAARSRNLALPPLEDARYEVGYGIQARVGDRLVHVGSARYMTMQGLEPPAGFEARRQEIHGRGGSVIYVAWNGVFAGAIELRPTLRREAKEVLARLKELGLTLHIISGDNAAPTAALAAELGIDKFFAEVLPQDKSRLIAELQEQGRRVCFVGDGINDAIALKQADVSVSIRGASSLATDTAQMILMDESLKQLAKLFEVAREYDANLKTLMTTTFVPGLVSLGSVFFLGAGNATALLLFNLSMIAGLVNAIWPAMQNLEEPDSPEARETVPLPESRQAAGAGGPAAPR
jgi:Cu2+-exporting ATPase